MTKKNKKIVFVIPTLDRSEQLDTCIESIFTASENTDLEVTIAISDNYSKTENKTKKEIIKSFSSEKGPKIHYKQQSEFIAWNDNLLAALTLAAKQKADYYWTMGDDDIVLPQGLKKIELLLNKEKNHSGLIHVCTSQNSNNTGNYKSISLWKAVNDYGFNPILGFMTSNIFHSHILKKLLALNEWNTVYKESCFTHAHALLHTCLYENIIIVDDAIVDDQGNATSEDSRLRWKKENISNRYYNIPHVVKYQIDNGIIPGKVSSNFFRYIKNPLWDRLINESIQRVILKQPFEAEIWNNIALIADCIDNPIIQKFILSTTSNIKSQIIRLNDTNEYLKNICRLNNGKQFPLQVWHEDPVGFDIMVHNIASKTQQIENKEKAL